MVALQLLVLTPQRTAAVVALQLLVLMPQRTAAVVALQLLVLTPQRTRTAASASGSGASSGVAEASPGSSAAAC